MNSLPRGAERAELANIVMQQTDGCGQLGCTVEDVADAILAAGYACAPRGEAGPTQRDCIECGEGAPGYAVEYRTVEEQIGEEADGTPIGSAAQEAEQVQCQACDIWMQGFHAASRGISRAGVAKLLSEVDCRIEHGAESGGHLEYVRKALTAALFPAAIPSSAPGEQP